MEKSSQAAKRWLQFYPLAWITGLYPAYAILLWVVARDAFIKPARHPMIIIMYIFFIVQILSMLIALPGPFADLYRALAIGHNIFLYTLIIVGANLCIKYDFLGQFSQRQIAKVICGFGIVSLVVYFISYKIVQGPLEFGGILTRVGFTRIDFLFNELTPRLSLLGDYVNTTGILALLLFYIYALQIDEKTSWFITFSCFIFATAIILMSGSRVCLAAIVMGAPFAFARNRIELVLYSLTGAIATIILVTYSDEAANIVSGIQESRQNSSSARGHIYSESLRVALETNPYTGLGMKPFYYTVPNFPLGSHSTFIGYVVKCGALGFVFCLLYLLWLAQKLITSSINAFWKGRQFTEFRGFWMLACFTLVMFFEDIDAYALNAFLFGCFLGSILMPKRKFSS